MGKRFLVLILLIITVVILLSVIILKIKGDRKTLETPVNDRDKGIDVIKNEPQGKKPDLWGIPGWGLALLTMLLAFIVLMVAGDIIGGISKTKENNPAELIAYILYNLIIAGGCFFICKQNPQSIWYVPLLSNIAGIVSALIEPNFWISSLWIVICSGWVLSIISSITGMLIGKRKTVVGNSET